MQLDSFNCSGFRASDVTSHGLLDSKGKCPPFVSIELTPHDKVNRGTATRWSQELVRLPFLLESLPAILKRAYAL